MNTCPNCEHQVPEAALFCPACGASLQGSSEDELASLVGRVLNQKYRLVDKVAEGGMALVYKAQHVFLEDHCAVKIIKRSLSNKEEMLKRFQREAKITRQVARRSPYIIAIYDFGVEDKIGFYYVMELLNGRPFADLLTEFDHPPDSLISSRFVCQMCEALGVVHEQGLVHRDIKPDNIFLNKDEQTGEENVKLLDFGIARPTYAKATMLTNYGRVMGTPEYMSPEQCKGPTPQQYERGESHLDGRSDIYSLGVLLYQCLTGEVPFPMPIDGGPMAIHKVMAGHVMEEPISPIEKMANARFSKTLSDVVMKALAKSPDDRFQTMLEFRDAIWECYPELRSGGGTGEQIIPSSQPENLDTVPLPGSMNNSAPQAGYETGPDTAGNPAALNDSLIGDTASNASVSGGGGTSDFGGGVSLDRTALDVQLPPGILEEAKQWHQNNLGTSDLASDQSLEPSPSEMASSGFNSTGDWGANAGQSKPEPAFEPHKTLAQSYDPEVIEQLREQAAAVAAGQHTLAGGESKPETTGGFDPGQTMSSPLDSGMLDQLRGQSISIAGGATVKPGDTFPSPVDVPSGLDAARAQRRSISKDTEPLLQQNNKGNNAIVWAICILAVVLGGGIAWYFIK